MSYTESKLKNHHDVVIMKSSAGLPNESFLRTTPISFKNIIAHICLLAYGILSIVLIILIAAICSSNYFRLVQMTQTISNISGNMNPYIPRNSCECSQTTGSVKTTLVFETSTTPLETTSFSNATQTDATETVEGESTTPVSTIPVESTTISFSNATHTDQIDESTTPVSDIPNETTTTSFTNATRTEATDSQESESTTPMSPSSSTTTISPTEEQIKTTVSVTTYFPELTTSSSGTVPAHLLLERFNENVTDIQYICERTCEDRRLFIKSKLTLFHKGSNQTITYEAFMMGENKKDYAVAKSYVAYLAIANLFKTHLPQAKVETQWSELMKGCAKPTREMNPHCSVN